MVLSGEHKHDAGRHQHQIDEQPARYHPGAAIGEARGRGPPKKRDELCHFVFVAPEFEPLGAVVDLLDRNAERARVVERRHLRVRYQVELVGVAFVQARREWAIRGRTCSLCQRTHPLMCVGLPASVRCRGCSAVRPTAVPSGEGGCDACASRARDAISSPRRSSMSLMRRRWRIVQKVPTTTTAAKATIEIQICKPFWTKATSMVITETSSMHAPTTAAARSTTRKRRAATYCSSLPSAVSSSPHR